jgi:steroid delta-isomerase-like uncharacterized protein
MVRECLSNETMTCLATALLEAWNAHDIDRILAFYAPDHEGIDIGEAAPQRGLLEVRQSVIRYLQAFPDLRIFLETTIIQDNQLVLIWTVSGTHRGMLMGIPPTRRLVRLRGISWLTVIEGKITRSLRFWDVAGLLRSLGLLPEL